MIVVSEFVGDKKCKDFEEEGEILGDGDNFSFESFSEPIISDKDMS
jgi:hypothetical protein